MVEVMVALLVLTVAVQILSSTVTASISYTRASEARRGGRGDERHRGDAPRPFYDLFATYNGDPNDGRTGRPWRALRRRRFDAAG